MKDYKYQAYVCNNAIYGCLVQLKASGVPDEDIMIMLNCMGKALVKMSILNKPIDYYIKHVEEWQIEEYRRRNQ